MNRATVQGWLDELDGQALPSEWDEFPAAVHESRHGLSVPLYAHLTTRHQKLPKVTTNLP